MNIMNSIKNLFKSTDSYNVTTDRYNVTPNDIGAIVLIKDCMNAINEINKHRTLHKEDNLIKLSLEDLLNCMSTIIENSTGINEETFAKDIEDVYDILKDTNRCILVDARRIKPINDKEQAITDLFIVFLTYDSYKIQTKSNAVFSYFINKVHSL